MNTKGELSNIFLVLIVAIIAVVAVLVIVFAPAKVAVSDYSGQASSPRIVIGSSHGNEVKSPAEASRESDIAGRATHGAESQDLFSVISREMYQHRVVVSRVSGDESLLHNPLPSYDPFNYGEIGYSDLNNEYHILFDECIWGDTDQGAEPVGLIEYYSPDVFYYSDSWHRDVYYEIILCANGYDVRYTSPDAPYASSQCRCKFGNAETREKQLDSWIQFVENLN